MILKTYMPMLVLAFCVAGSASAKWQVIDARWRPDANAFSKDQVWEHIVWTEGWNEKEQYYPKYAIPAGSIHVIFKNASTAADSITLTQVDGKPLADACTTLKKAGPVVWYRVESPRLPMGEDRGFATQENVPAGEWVECDLRLREVPKGPVRLEFASKSGEVIEATVEIKQPGVRLESVSFSPRIDLMCIYVRSLDGKPVGKCKVQLDGKELTAQTRWSAGPSGSGLVLAEVTLAEPLAYGTHHLLEVELPGGEKLAQPVRAWDDYFCIGTYGTVDDARVKAAKEHGINTYFHPANDILDNYGMNTAPGGAGKERQHRSGTAGLLYRQNWDEPDAYDWHEGEELPFPQRLGVLGQSKVLPIQRDQRKADPEGLNLLLVDGTFKPMNWYVYGQIPDVFCTDPYVPLGGRQLDYVWNALESARDASTPRPLVAVLWACSLSSEGKRVGNKAPTAEEGRMQIFYALGSGVKGISYFIDLTQKTGEGQFIGLSDCKELWEETGRTNADVAALAPYLSIGCPVGQPKLQGEVWTRALMCGSDKMVLIAVNTRHHIAYETASELSINIPLKDVSVRMPLPEHWKTCSVQEVREGKLVPFKAEVKAKTVTMPMDELATARAFVLTRSE